MVDTLRAVRRKLRSQHALHVLRLALGAPRDGLPVRLEDARVSRVRGRVLGVGTAAHERQGAPTWAEDGANVLRGRGDKMTKAPDRSREGPIGRQAGEALTSPLRAPRVVVALIYPNRGDLVIAAGRDAAPGKLG